MRIYQDIFNNEELISDSYKMEQKFDGVIIEVPARMVAIGQDNIDVGCGNAFGGTNEDEEQGAQGGNVVPKVIDVIDNFHYEETNFDKAGFKEYFKGYMKKLMVHIKENKEDRLKGFQAGAKEFFGWALNNFAELSFYTPPSFDMDNMIIMSYFKNEDDEAPRFIFMMDGLKFYKV